MKAYQKAYCRRGYVKAKNSERQKILRANQTIEEKQEQARLFRERYKSDPVFRAGILVARQSYLKSRNADPRYRLLRNAKARAKEKGIPFALSLSDITIPTHCPILNQPLIDSSVEPANDFTISLDRIDPFLGYIPGNVWVISRKANQMKSSATIADMEQIIAAIKKFKEFDSPRI